MRQAKARTGSALQRPTGDQDRCGHAGLGGHSGAESDVGLGHSCWQVLVAGMHQHQGVEFGGDGEKPVKARVGQFETADLGADLDTEKPRRAHAPAHLVDGLVGILQWDGRERGEAGRMLTHHPSEEVVLDSR